MYSFLRGRQGIQGFTGPTGATGATGASGNKFTSGSISPQVVTTTGTILVVSSSIIDGSITFFAQVTFDASTLNVVTLTPRVNGVSLTAFISRATTPAGQTATMSLVGAATITIGDSFDILVSVNTGTASITSGGTSYSIV